MGGTESTVAPVLRACLAGAGRRQRPHRSGHLRRCRQRGGRRPEPWNNNAYSDAIGKFVLANCGKPNTYCVPFRDVLAWMKMQDPATLARLQAQKPQLQAG